MAKKTILLIEDDPATEAKVGELLGKEYGLETVQDREQAAKWLEKKSPDIIFIDYDLKGEDGLQVFREIHAVAPDLSVVMLSASGSIPLAVAAAKAGVADFLRKPLAAEQLKQALMQNIAKPQMELAVPSALSWLRGESPALHKMLSALEEALKKNNDIILAAEQGINKRDIAALIHDHGPYKKRKLVSLDLASFRKEALETHFWTVLRDVLAIPDASSVQEEENLCGTLYVEGVETIDESFRSSLLGFFSERKGKIDKSIRAVISADSAHKYKSGNFIAVTVPALRERKEDLPRILASVLSSYSRRYNKNIRHISAALLDFLMSYDYPGNYAELENLIHQAVLASSEGKLELSGLPVNFNEFMRVQLKENGLALEAAKRNFEKKLYQFLFDKLKGDQAAAARFLDLPKTALAERWEELQTEDLTEPSLG